jgi:hypothetical protein
MKTNHRSPKVDAKQYLRYVKTFLWAKRRDKDELIKTVMGRHMDNYPASAISLEQAVTDMDAESQLRQTGLSTTDMYAIKEALNLIEKQNDTETTSTTDGNGHQEDEVSDGHLPIQADSEILDQPVKERATRSRKSNKSKHDGNDPLLG